jgi:hypothetical protein
MPNSTNDGMISKNIKPIMILVCLRMKSNMVDSQATTVKNTKGEHPFAFVRWWWVLTGLEPPTYAV